MFEHLNWPVVFVQNVIEQGLAIVGPFQGVVGVGDGIWQQLASL